VVWCGRGLAAPARLDEALAGSGCVGVHVDNQYAAMAELCKGRGLGGASGGRGGLREPARVLLAVEPSTLASLGELLDVAERYAPEAVLWAYESRPTERIRAVTAEERSSWRSQPKGWFSESNPVPEPHPITANAFSTHNVKLAKPTRPNLKLAGDGPGIPAVQAPGVRCDPPEQSYNSSPEHGLGEETPPARSSHLLTDEELAMLLAIEPKKGHN